jgi:hypothetical protein
LPLPGRVRPLTPGPGRMNIRRPRLVSALEEAQLNMKVHPGIRINRIPAEGGGGLILAAAVPVLVLIAAPALLPVAAAAVVGGVVLAYLLHRSYY